MPRRRSLRYHQQRQDSDDEFETPALQIAAEGNNPPVAQRMAASDESDDELQSESGLGESPEEDLIEEAGESSSDDDNGGDSKDGNAVDSDSDSAPEEVSFAKSQEAEEKRRELIKGEIVKGIKQERERRRKRDELFKLQKKEKLAALNKRKLPEELLAELSQQSGKKQKTDQSKEDSQEDKEIQSSEEGGEIDLESDSGEEEDGGETELADFLPLADIRQERVEVVSLQGRKGHGGVVAQSVADFKQALLYGGRHKRVTSQQARNQKAKRLARR